MVATLLQVTFVLVFTFLIIGNVDKMPGVLSAINAIGGAYVKIVTALQGR